MSITITPRPRSRTLASAKEINSLPNTMRITKPAMAAAAALLTLYVAADPRFGAAVFVIFAALAVGIVAGIIEDNF